MSPISKRRSKIEAYLEVLKAVKDGTRKPTRIMYVANLSWQPLLKILSSLVSQGLIEEVDYSGTDKRSNKVYNITQKGEDALRFFEGSERYLKTEE